jgi:formylglycine-generating enzyme required for sulfatase activity
MRSTRLLHFVAALALMGIPASGTARSAEAQRGTVEAYRETIPGTLVSFEMTPVPAGTVPLGGKPVVVEAIHIGRTEVTWDMYDVFALGLDAPKEGSGADAVARPSQPYGAPDYGWGHAGYPVISVTRAAAQAFCEWLSARTGRTYRLPTEAEWLRAAALAGGDRLTLEQRDALAWHRDNSSARTHPVGARKPDALGLFDLFGNAAEWVTTSDGTLVVRGGSFRDARNVVGPAARGVQDDSWNERDPQLPKSRWWLSDAPFAGFRIVHARSAAGPRLASPESRAPSPRVPSPEPRVPSPGNSRPLRETVRIVETVA